eukprot:750930-Hanusia_phi.AAC.3
MLCYVAGEETDLFDCRKPRTDGAYYDKMWQSAVAAQTEFVSITSYNEWGEGTQIEPAVPKTVDLEHALDEIFRAQLGLEVRRLPICTAGC